MRFDGQLSGALSEYREFLPPAALAERFLCLWTQTITGPRGGYYEHRVLPDACIDIVLMRDEPPMVIGPWDVPFVARLAVGTCIVGARLHPGRASSVLGIPASELLNRAIPIADVTGGMQGRRRRLEEVTEQPSGAARRSALAEVLCGTVEDLAPVDQGVLAGIQWLARHPQGRIQQLSRWIGISERQLHRRFSAAIGYGPKMFQSVLRFQRLLKTASERGGKVAGGEKEEDKKEKPKSRQDAGATKAGEGSLAELAASVGYADQAHMTREVRRLAGLRPSVLLRSTESTLIMSDLFKT